MERINIEIQPEKKKEFKIICAKLGTTMKKIVWDLINNFIDSNQDK